MINSPILIRVLLFIASLLLLSSCAMFQPDRIGRGTAKQIDETIDDLTNENRLKAMTKSAVEGAISGMSSKDSEEEISKLSETLAESLGEKLNEVFINLDTRTPGVKFAKGVTDSLITKEVERQVTTFLSGIIHKSGGDINDEIDLLTETLNESIASLFPNLGRQIEGLESSLQKVLSTTLKDSLSTFISGALADLDLNGFSHKISTELLSAELRDTLRIVVAEIQREINLTEDVPGFLEVIKRYIYQFLAIAFFLIAALIYFRFRLKQREEYEEDMAAVIEGMLDEDPSLKDKFEKMLADKNRLKVFKEQVKRKNRS